MDFKRKITKLQIDGEDVFLKSPNAALQIKIATINIGPEPDQEKYIRIMAEAIAMALVDESGKPIFDSGDAVLAEMEINLFTSVSNAILQAYPWNRESKNSESVPISSLPSISQES